VQLEGLLVCGFVYVVEGVVQGAGCCVKEWVRCTKCPATGEVALHHMHDSMMMETKRRCCCGMGSEAPGCAELAYAAEVDVHLWSQDQQQLLVGASWCSIHSCK
jgi:hypothetical protein